MPDSVDIQKVFSDPAFRQLPGLEKVKVMDDLDPDFKGLPNMREKMNALQGMLGNFKDPRKVEDKGFFQTLGNAAKGFAGLAGDVAMSPFSMDAARRAGDKIVQPQVEQFRKAGETLAKEQPRQGLSTASEAFGHAAAGLLPVFGPLAAETGEALGEGRYGEAGADALLLGLSKVAGPGPSRTRGMITRGVEGAAGAAGRGAARAGSAVRDVADTVSGIKGVRTIPAIHSLLDVLKRDPPDLKMSPADIKVDMFKKTHGGKPPGTLEEKIQAQQLYDAYQVDRKSMLKKELEARKGPPEPKRVPPPPLRGSSLPPEAPTAPAPKRVPPPPLRGSSLPAKTEATEATEVPPDVGSTQGPSLHGWPDRKVFAESRRTFKAMELASPLHNVGITADALESLNGKPSPQLKAAVKALGINETGDLSPETLKMVIDELRKLESK